MRGLVIFLALLIVPITMTAQDRYRAEAVSKRVNGQTTVDVDHSLIIIDADNSIAEIRSEKTTLKYFFFGKPEKQTTPNGEELFIFDCHDQKGKECKFIMGGVDKPDFRVWYDKNNFTIYVANIIL
jgi:hypothetical protein